jgi:hypothetical protein
MIELRRLVDIGPPSEYTGKKLDGIQIEERGIIERKAVSRVLQRASLGVLCRNPVALTKSGALAAYLAHGVPAVIALRGQAVSNPALSDGTHYVSLEQALQVGTEWEALGDRGREWYLEHAHSRKVAQSLLEFIRSIGGTSMSGIDHEESYDR